MMSVQRPISRSRAFAEAAFCTALAFAALCFAIPASAQDSNGPLTPPPTAEHDVHRVSNTNEPEAPPSLPPAEIIKAFTEKEQQYFLARARYGYKKSVKFTEYGKDGQPSGEFLVTVQAVIDSEGRPYEKVIEQPTPTVRMLQLTPEDFKVLSHIPAYPLVPGQLAKYQLRYIGDEKVDEIDCYLFEAKPKILERAHALFQGVVWVDKKYLEVVKTYGKWVTDLGDERLPELPFTSFETYRENVDGKYWFPDYSRSDDYLHFKDTGDVPVRVVIKWTDFKPLSAAPPVSQPAPAVPPAAPKP